MALGATLYLFKIDLADSDRGVYQPVLVGDTLIASVGASALECERDHGVEIDMFKAHLGD